MTETSDSMVFYPSKFSSIMLFLASGLFVAAGLWISTTDGWPGYFCAAIFAPGIPLAIIQMLPGSTWLQIDADGFIVCNLYRKTVVPWSGIDDVFVLHLRETGVKVNEIVGFNYTSSFKKPSIGRKLVKQVGKCEGVLPLTYGKTAGELSELMNDMLGKYQSRL